MQTIKIKAITGPCRTCGQPTDQFAGSNLKFNCDACDAQLEDGAKTDYQRRQDEKRARHWENICPAEYRETDTSNPALNQQCLALAQHFELGGKGLGFVGSTGIGKTRTLFLALRRVHDLGFSTMAIHHEAHTAASIAAAGGERDAMEQAKAKELLRRCRRAKALLFDDIGKGRSTPTAVEEFSALIEYRTSRKLVTLWTSQAGAKWMIERLGPDAGPAIARRLAEFSTIPDLPRQ